MTISDVNSEEMCQIAVSQAMKHMRPDTDSELLNVEDNFPSEATRGEAPGPVLMSVVTSRVMSGVSSKPLQVTEPIRARGLRTTINTPGAISNDRLNYMYSSQNGSTEEHIPGQCSCDECNKQQEALMNWALMAAQQQHSTAIAEATASAEAAQKRGDGPKPMMVTPYKHNWVIAGAHNEVACEERWLDWKGIVQDLTELLKKKEDVSMSCCTSPHATISKLLRL